MEYFLHNLLPIIVLTVALTIGAYVAIMLFRLYSQRNERYIQSFFYHQILILIFGVYGLVGSVLMSNFLLKYYINITIIEKAISLIFYMAYPFLIAAVFMLIKAGFELLNKTIKTLWVVLYFILTVLFTFGLAFFIDRIYESFNFEFFVSSKYLLYFCYEIILIVVFAIFSFHIFFKKETTYIKSIFFYFLFYNILISILFIVASKFYFARIYFLLFYFGGNIFLIYIIPKLKYSTPNKTTTNRLIQLYEKYAITKREKEIISEICRGKTNQEIADTLFISLQTVKDHIHNIFGKVGVKNRIQLRNIFSEN